MKITAAFFGLLILFVGSLAQSPDAILATANNQTFTAGDLSPEARQAIEDLPSSIAGFRTRLLERQIVEMLLETEAAARATTTDKLVEIEVNKRVSAPTAKEIQAVYDANRASIGTKTLEEIRPQIVVFLQTDRKQKLYGEYLSNLKIKYKAALGKDINAKNLAPFEAVASVNGKTISAQSFETKNKTALADFEANVYDQARASLEQIVYSNLLVAEAKAQNIDAGDLIAREITSKTDGSDYQRDKFDSALRKRLFEKYAAKFLIKEVANIVQTISTDDDPSLGKEKAPVTVVMFSDFQCSYCAATHPTVVRVLDEYAGQIRFVLRDFPLTEIHADAFRAALAADAAGAQGKYFQYVELLYSNQNSLDAASLKQFAATIGLDRKRFDADLDAEKFAAEIRKDMEDGKRYGITGTPTIFVNGIKLRQFSAEKFRDAIEKALK